MGNKIHASQNAIGLFQISTEGQIPWTIGKPANYDSGMQLALYFRDCPGKKWMEWSGVSYETTNQSDHPGR
jgi:hypothetical protein